MELTMLSAPVHIVNFSQSTTDYIGPSELIGGFYISPTELNGGSYIGPHKLIGESYIVPSKMIARRTFAGIRSLGPFLAILHRSYIGYVN